MLRYHATSPMTKNSTGFRSVFRTKAKHAVVGFPRIIYPQHRCWWWHGAYLARWYLQSPLLSLSLSLRCCWWCCYDHHYHLQPTVGLDASHSRSEVVDGFFTCHFSRQRTVEGVAEIYDLAAPNMYYLIFAKGQAASLSKGLVVYNYKTLQFVDF